MVVATLPKTIRTRKPKSTLPAWAQDLHRYSIRSWDSNPRKVTVIKHITSRMITVGTEATYCIDCDTGDCSCPAGCRRIKEDGCRHWQILKFIREFLVCPHCKHECFLAYSKMFAFVPDHNLLFCSRCCKPGQSWQEGSFRTVDAETGAIIALLFAKERGE